MTGRAGKTAETLVFVGLILQGITVLVLLGLGLFLLSFPLLGDIVLFLALLALIWLILIYVFSYARIRDGDYEGADMPTLVFAILSLISGGIVSGVLYLVAYVKLGDAIEEEEALKAAYRARSASPKISTPTLSSYHPAGITPLSPAASPPSSTPVPSASNFCSNCGRPTAPQAHFCRSCGAPLE